MEIEFPYKEEESNVFERVKRPRVKLKVFSELARDWVIFGRVKALDLFDATFLKGEKIKLHLEE
jgi:hypothetical protein